MASRQTQAQIVLTLGVVAVLGLIGVGVFMLVSSDSSLEDSVEVASQEPLSEEVPVDTTLTVDDVGIQLEEGFTEIGKVEPFIPVGDTSFQSPDNFYWYPVSTNSGPANFSESVSSGFGQTSDGAALAATHIFYRIAGVSSDWRTALDTQTVGPGKETRIALNEVAEELLAENSSLARVEYPAGWDVLAYDDNDATVVIYYGYKGHEGYYFRELRVVWLDGDWKLFIGENADFNSGSSTVGPSDLVLEGAFK